MKRRTKLFVLAVILPLVALSACATGYEKEGVFTNGYSDYKLDDHSFVVTFRANEYTPQEKVMKYVLQRASEITLKNGFRYFTISDKIDSQKKLDYPSMRIAIDCYAQKPDNTDSIDAAQFLAKNP